MVEFTNFNGIKPMVNQMETHIFNQQVQLKEYAEKYHIRLEAWAPFGEGRGGTFDTKTSSFFSHQDPAMVEWFVQMVEERKKNNRSENGA
jgi:diketogulonate reductase-like aldo/keto reductase